MEKFKSDKFTINCNIQSVFDKLSNPSHYKSMLEENADKLPPEAKAQLDKINFTEQGISMESPMGNVVLAIDKDATVSPNRIAYTAVGSPIKVSLVVELKQVDENVTEECAAIEIDIPFMLKAMVGPKLKEGAQKFGEAIAKIPYDKL